MTLKVRILPFLATFTQLTARLKNLLRGWLLVLSLKAGLVECATVCIKSEVILANTNANIDLITKPNHFRVKVLKLEVFFTKPFDIFPMIIMAIRVVEFSNRGYKIRKIFAYLRINILNGSS